MVEEATVDITPAHGCGFRLYCGFEDWFIGEGGLLLLLTIGALLVKRWRDLPLVALIAIIGPLAAAHLLGMPAFMLDRLGWRDLPTFAIVLAIVTAIAAAVHGLKRLALHVFRRKPAPA